MAAVKEAYQYNGETAGFPILCQTCIGKIPSGRMTKVCYRMECKICSSRLTVSWWHPSNKCLEKTEICQACSKQKDACQLCVRDLDTGLPIEVQDSEKNLKDDIPKFEVNKKHCSQNMKGEVANTDDTSSLRAIFNSFDSEAEIPSDLMNLARMSSYYIKDHPALSSPRNEGCECVKACRHRPKKLMDLDNHLRVQDIKARYNAINNPVADHLLRKQQKISKLESLEDKITGKEVPIMEPDPNS